MSQPHDGELHVSPVHLAGPDAGEPALQPLLDAGFRHEIDVKGNALLTSPGGRHLVDYMPGGLTHALWRITESPDRYAPPTWQATFTLKTPPEVVAAVTTALTEEASPWPGGRRPRAEEVLRPLAGAGWRRRANQWETGYTSPDLLTTVTYDTTPGHPLDADYEPWLITAGRTLGHGHSWYGAFTTHTPTHLVAAAAGRLADPEPVSRTATAGLHPEATVTEIPAYAAAGPPARRASAARSRTSTPADRQIRPQPSSPSSPAPITRAHRRK